MTARQLTPPPGRELDRLVAVARGIKVVTITVIGGRGTAADVGTVGEPRRMADGREGLEAKRLPEFSTDDRAALRLLADLERERGARAQLTRRGFVPLTYGYFTESDPDGVGYCEGWTCELRDCESPWSIVTKGAPTLAHAIALAFLALVAPATEVAP